MKTNGEPMKRQSRGSEIDSLVKKFFAEQIFSSTTEVLSFASAPISRFSKTLSFEVGTNQFSVKAMDEDLHFKGASARGSKQLCLRPETASGFPYPCFGGQRRRLSSVPGHQRGGDRVALNDQGAA